MWLSSHAESPRSIKTGNASATICADMADGMQHRRCSRAGRHLVKRQESLFFTRHLFAMHATIRAMNKGDNDGRTCTMDEALSICGNDITRAEFLQSLRCFSRCANKKTYTGGFFEITGDVIEITKECAIAYAIDQDVSALRTFARLRDQFTTIDEGALYGFVMDHQLAANRISLQLSLTTWRQFAIVFYLSYRHHLGDQFVPLADVATHLDVDSKRVTASITQMCAQMSNQIMKRRCATDDRSFELALSHKLRGLLALFHAQHDGFLPQPVTLDMFQKPKKVKLASFHSQNKIEQLG
tara:strand:- start:729 stop:1622 length:894 start_codon:yes stop_codon:yes gene_type:complete